MEDELRNLIEKILIKNSLSSEQARIIADVYVTADLRGNHSHGVARICSFLLPLIKNKTMDKDAEYTEFLKTNSWKHFDANNAIGPITSYYAINKTINLAKENGIGIVSVSNSTHFGLASYYSLKASNEGLIGIVFSNGSPAVVPPGANQAILGTNALSVSFPNDSNPIILDCALSSTSLGKLFLAKEHNEEVSSELCSSYLLNKLDMQTQSKINPEIIYNNRAVAPLQYGEGLYKGFSLGLIFDLILSLIFGGKLSSQTSYGQASHVFISIDPLACVDQNHYLYTMKALYENLESLKYLENYEKFRIPGERSNNIFKKHSQFGIPLNLKVYNQLYNELDREYERIT